MDTYSTKNLQLAAYLYSANLRFEGTYSIGNEVFFKFSPKDKAEELVSNYYQDKATCNPRELLSRLENLKDLIFATK